MQTMTNKITMAVIPTEQLQLPNHYVPLLETSQQLEEVIVNDDFPLDLGLRLHLYTVDFTAER